MLVPYIYTSSQRGLVQCTRSQHLFTAGSFAIYYMRLLCYDCYSTCEATRDQLFLCSYGISAMPLGLRYYIREDRLSLALLADPLMEYRPLFDLYI